MPRVITSSDPWSCERLSFIPKPFVDVSLRGLVSSCRGGDPAGPHEALPFACCLSVKWSPCSTSGSFDLIVQMFRRPRGLTCDSENELKNDSRAVKNGSGGEAEESHLFLRVHARHGPNCGKLPPRERRHYRPGSRRRERSCASLEVQMAPYRRCAAPFRCGAASTHGPLRRCRLERLGAG